MSQSVKFWSKDIRVMQLPPKFRNCEFFANLFIHETIKIFEFALVRPGPYYQIVLYIC